MSKNLIQMKKIIEDKVVWIPLLITAICSYGFFITNYAIGLDDTSIPRYYVEGRAPAMGRYTMYLLERIYKVAEFSPFIMEFISILMLMLTAVVCIVLFKNIIKEEIPMVIYSVFACVFISYPLINEVIVYYVHGTPGIALGYLLTTLGILWIYQFIQNKKKIGNLIAAIFAVYFAVGLYESFTLLYIMMCAAVLFLYLVFREERLKTKQIITWLVFFIIPILLSVFLRTVTHQILEYAFDIPNHMRGVESMKWIIGENGKENLNTLLREFYAMYVVNALFYLPIRNYILSMVVFLIYVVVKIIKKRNGWIALGGLGIFLSPWLLMPIEGVVTTYRANLGLAFATALAIALVFYEIYKRIKWKWIIVVIATIIIYNQAFDLNHWFYVERLKYDYQVEMTSQIYYELAENYDLSKPVVFISNGEIPKEFAKFTHIEYESSDYNKVKKVVDLFGIELPERFFDSKGYIYAEVPNLWLYNWGQNAFEEGATEIAKFFAMQGYEIVPGTNGNWQEAMTVNVDMPSFPKEGSIIELDRYIVVNISD